MNFCTTKRGGSMVIFRFIGLAGCLLE